MKSLSNPSTKSSIRFTRLGRFNGPNIGADALEASWGVLERIKNGVIILRLVIDCGAMAIRDESPVEHMLTGDLSFFDDGKEVDAVILTHGHLDHVGGLPYLAKYLAPNAPIVMTHSTKVIMTKMYASDREMADREGAVEKDYDIEVLADLERRFVGLRGEGKHLLLDTIEMWVQGAGHIYGACSFTLRIGGETIHYSGDRCDHDQPTLAGARPLPADWQPTIVAGSDCTYGADQSGFRGNWAEEADRLLETCYEEMLSGNRVLIYTFGLYRAGIIAHCLRKYGVTEVGTVAMDGISAKNFSKMFTERAALWTKGDDIFRLGDVWPIRGRRERYDALAVDGGLTVIATPGMVGPGYPGAGTFWRREVFGDPNATVILTGYVAPDSDGAKLLAAITERDELGLAEIDVTFREQDSIGGPWHDVTITIRCKVMRVRLGGHSGRDATIQWFRQVNAPIMVLSHGSPSALENIERELRASGHTGRLVRTDLERSFEVEIEEETA